MGALDAAEPHQSLQVNFLDLTIFQSPTGPPRLVHRLYDKRRESAFRNIPLVQFPHWRSVMPVSFKLGCVHSQIFRLVYICSFQADFVVEAASLLAILHSHKNYPLRSIELRLRKSLRSFPSLYGTRSPSSVGTYIEINNK